MTFSLQDFRALKASFQETLYTPDGEAVSCRLHDCNEATGSLLLVYEGLGEEQHLHVAEACNIAAVIASIRRLLSLPRSNVACQQLSEILLLRLDVLREYIHAAIKGNETCVYKPTEADMVIRRWAGFLKHPSRYVFAHQCFADWELEFLPDAVMIDSGFLAEWDGLSNADRDKRKSDLAHRVVSVALPDAQIVSDFFKSCADHVNTLINASMPNAGQGQVLP